jgi:protein ImuB
LVTREPAWLTLSGEQRRRIAAWSGPWTLDQRWWDTKTARTVHRFHVVDDDGIAWLLLLDGDIWRLEARYD